MAAETRFLFAGGGSGGHLFPGLAVAEELRRADAHCRVEFIAADRPADRAIFAAHPSEQVTHLSVESTAALRRRPWAWLTANWNAYRRCRRLLTDSRPHCLIGLGGFASVPAVIAARRLGIPIVLMEQNVFPGRATRWLSRLADQVCLSGCQTRAFLPPAAVTVVTGNPVRPEFPRTASTPTFDGPIRCGEEYVTLLVLGGSLGATALNEGVPLAVAELPDSLRNRMRVIHQTGADRTASVAQAYADLGIDHQVTPFIDNLADVAENATLVVSRAGGSILAELACLGAATLLVPYPQAADNHQWHNAQPFVTANAARLVDQGTDIRKFAADLRTELAELLSTPHLLQEMRSVMHGLSRPNAAADVAQVIRQTASGLPVVEPAARVHAAERVSPSHFDFERQAIPGGSRRDGND